MKLTYRLFHEQDLSAVVSLQREWFQENITFGIVPESPDEILRYQNDYFFVALDGDEIIGYTTAEVIQENVYNIFPQGARFLQVNDLYVKASYRSRHIGEELLSLAEHQAQENGLQHIFISSAAKDAAVVRNFYTRNGYGIWTTTFYKRMDWDVRTYNPGELSGYRFVVIFARYRNKWLYSRHRERDTWETAGGHIEPGETPLDAAKRELFEETGAVAFKIMPAFDYSVHTPTGFANGQVFFAEISSLGPLPDSEMCETRLFDATPDATTYPKILPVLYDKLQGWMNQQNSKEGG